MSIIKRKAGSEDIVKSVLKFDSVPTEGSPNLVESGAVAQALANGGKIVVFHVTFPSGVKTYPNPDEILDAIYAGKFVVIDQAGLAFPGNHIEWLLEYTVRGAQDAIKFVNGSNTLIATRDNTAETPAWTWFEGDIGFAKTGAIGTEYADLTFPVTAGTACMHDGLRYVASATISTAEDWTAAHWTEKSVEDEIGKILDGGALTDAASVDVPNNALSTLATAQAALTLNVNVDANEVPNFAVEVTPSANCTLTVTKTVNSTASTLSPSVAGGNTLTSGKKYQVTCVGSCWTLAEFTVPTP